jgi:hypothetical protein
MGQHIPTAEATGGGPQRQEVLMQEQQHSHDAQGAKGQQRQVQTLGVLALPWQGSVRS